MDLPLISVVVPCYNEKKYIEKCILSILDQSIPQVQTEIFVIDGMSNDGTREILFRLQKEFNRFQVIDNIKRKTPFARNLGVKASTGKFIAILDAHTEYDKNYLANSLKLFEEHPDISCAGGPIESVGKNNFGKATALAMSHPLGVGNAKHRFPDYEGYAEGACFPVFKKEVFDKLGTFDEELVRNQDDEFNLRMKKNGMKVYLSPKAKATYFVRDTPAKLFKQYFDYGYWRMAVIKKHKLPMSFRQLVPVLFIMIIFLSLFLSPFIKVNFMATIFIIPAIYTLTLSAASVPIIIKNGAKVGMLFPVAAVILHFSYAFGFLKGIFHFTR